MLDRTALRDLFDYTTFTWAAYGNALGALPSDALARPVAVSGWPAPPQDSPDAITTWDQLQTFRQPNRARLRRVIDETPDAVFAAPSERPLPNTDWYAVSPAQIVEHILLHERGHHGDISTLFEALGAAPPSVDYLTYLFFQQRKAD